MLAIIGSNGAGKTCLLNCISGFYHPQSGRILFNGQDVTALTSHEIAGLGISRTFQNIALYSGLTTLDNLLAARHIHFRSKAWGFAYFGPAHREEIRHRKVVEEIIDFLEIELIRKKWWGACLMARGKEMIR